MCREYRKLFPYFAWLAQEKKTKWEKVIRCVRKPFMLAPLPLSTWNLPLITVSSFVLGTAIWFHFKDKSTILFPIIPSHLLSQQLDCVCISFFFLSLEALRRLRNRHLSWIWPSLPTRKGSREHHISRGRSTEPFVYTFGNTDWWMILSAGSE